MRRAPDPRRLRNHIMRVTSDRLISDRVRRMSAEYQKHHAPTECAEHLEELAVGTATRVRASAVV